MPSTILDRGPILPLKLLFSHPYIAPNFFSFFEKHSDEMSLLIDSGAFTYYNAGKELSVEQYIDFIKGLPIKPWGYFQLDVIRDPEKTKINLYKMLDAGLNPIPIITRGADPEYIDELYGISDIIGIGALRMPRDLAYINSLMPSIKGRKYHLLGVGSPKTLAKFRPYSSDHTNYLDEQKYGKLSLYMGRGRFIHLRKSFFKKRPPYHIVKRIKELGFEPERLATHMGWIYNPDEDYRVKYGSIGRTDKLSYAGKLHLYSHYLFNEDMQEHGTSIFLVSQASFCDEWSRLLEFINGTPVDECK